MSELFGKKKSNISVSKGDIKKSITKANDKLKRANSRLEDNIEKENARLESILADCHSGKKDLEDIESLKVYAQNELEAQQVELAKVQSITKEVSSNATKLSEENNLLKENNAKLKEKERSLSKSIASLESKKSEFATIKENLKAIEIEEADGQETLELLAIELNELEGGVESYISRKSAAESEFKIFKGEIERAKRIAEEELREVRDLGDKINVDNAAEMSKLDHAIADRLTELNDMTDMIQKKDYELLVLQSKIRALTDQVQDAEDNIAYSLKREQDKVNSIKKDFKEWKLTALDDVARLKIKGKIDNIDKAGLGEILNG